MMEDMARCKNNCCFEVVRINIEYILFPTLVDEKAFD